MTTRPELSGTFGMVASTHWLATGAGMSVLERGGNAIDAACAAGFVLQVVEPHLNGPGGDLPAIVYSVADARAQVVCGQGVAPAAATIERFADLGLNQVPGTGLLAATVPGAFAAWTAMLERVGQLGAVRRARLRAGDRRGRLSDARRIAAVVDAVAGFFTEHWPSSAQVWLPDGRAPQSGTIWRSPALAADLPAAARRGQRPDARSAHRGRPPTLLRGLRRRGDRSVLRPGVARQLGPRTRRSADAVRTWPGWRPTVEEPVRVPYAGRYEVLKTPPWGQGPVLLQQLRLLEALQIADVPMRSGSGRTSSSRPPSSPSPTGRPGTATTPRCRWTTLLSPAYAQSRARLVTDTADLQLRPGSPDGRTPRLAQLSAQVPAAARQLPGARSTGTGLGEPTVRPSELGAATPATSMSSIAGEIWSRRRRAAAGCRARRLSPASAFRWVPARRCSTWSPACRTRWLPGSGRARRCRRRLALRDGEPWLAFGTPGGDQQDQWQLPFFLDVVQAGPACRRRSTRPPCTPPTSPRPFIPARRTPARSTSRTCFAAEALADLRARGHRVVPPGPWSLGRISAVERDGSILRAGANARGAQGYAAGR